MGETNKKFEVLSELIESLESRDTFQHTVELILHKTIAYINADCIALLQKGSDDEWTVIASEGECIEEAKKCDVMALNGENSISVPIRINDIDAMHFVIYDKNNIKLWSDNEDNMHFIYDVTGIIQSIAQMRVTNNSLLSSYEVLKDILNNIGSGIIVCDTATGNILFENKVAAESKEIKDTIKECMQDILVPTEEDVEKTLEEYINNAEGNNIDGYYDFSDYTREYIRPVEKYNAESGQWFEVRFTKLIWIDASEVIVCTASDITQKKKNQQKIEFQAHNDFLTGLYNRMKCESDLKTIINEAIRDGVKGAVLFIDLDDFKHINDGLGHQYGDILLQQIAAGLQSIVGLRGRCYRMGGDEFVAIVMPDMFLELERIANKVKEIFNKPWYLMETEYFCTMSMGIAVFPDDSKDVHEIIRMADIAMYESKKNGKNGYSFYDVCNKQNSVRRLDIENNMRQAVATGIDEFVVFYQPVVDINTEECASCEALVRWDSKSLGFMGPGDFIPLAEYLGLITSIGDYVLEEACRQCRYWNEHGMPDFHINVNLSVVQLLQKDIVDTVAKVLKKTGVNPRNIVLEITESFAINDMDRVLNIINGIRELGPKIALDDFGTGYSSLNYIKQLPFDIIKVDKTFIDDITEDEYAQAFIKLIVELSATIGTKIVVEGVEDKSQLDILRELGVDFIQGYYYGKPEPAYEFERLNFKGRINI